MKQPSANRRQQFGNLGEQLAASYLLKHGYRILSRNFHTLLGEIDIIARSGDTLVFIEVKTRVSHAFGRPEESVTPIKLTRIRRAAAAYCAKFGSADASQRIEVIAVELGPDGDVRNLTHIRDITW